jgi:hypothetical protein
VFIIAIIVLNINVFAGSKPTINKSYIIKNVGSGKYLNVSGNSCENKANVTVCQKDGSTGQTFKIGKNDNGFTLTPTCSNGCLNIYGAKAVSGYNVCIWNKSGSATQAWQFVAVSNGYKICSVSNTSCVLNSTGSTNGANVNIKTYSSSNKYQVWVFEEVDPIVLPTKSSITTSQITTVMNKYNFINGKYWTYNNTVSGASSKYTSSSYAEGGNYLGYKFSGSIQCHGFGRFIGYKITGTTPSFNSKGWTTYITKADLVKAGGLKIGDVIRTNGHTAVVYKIASTGKITFVECSGGSRDKNIIRVGYFFGSSCYTLDDIVAKYGYKFVWRWTK